MHNTLNISTSPRAPLLGLDTDMEEAISPSPSPSPSPSLDDKDITAEHLSPFSSAQSRDLEGSSSSTSSPRYSKRRYLGLFQLALLNIIVSWSWLTFAPVSETSADYFAVSVSAVNWLSTGFLFAFVVATPATLYVLNKHGPKGAITVASVLVAIGSWVRYAGTRSAASYNSGNPNGRFGVVVLGQVLLGLAQPFVLSAPTRFSEQWFSPSARIAATALTTLANPFGGALGQLIDPFWATNPQDIPNMVLWVSIISTVSCLPTLFLPSAPSSYSSSSSTIALPLSPTGTAPKEPEHPPLTLRALRSLLRNPSLPLLAFPFSIYVAAFNATSSLLNPILQPFGFSETEAGIAGALLIVIGLVSSAITSPILDRRPKWRVPAIKALVPVIAVCYVLLIWAPTWGSVDGVGRVVGVYILLSILGGASFSLLPLALEMLVDVSGADVGAEVTSSLAWAAGQLGGGIFIVVMDALDTSTGMQRGVIFQAVIAVAAVPPVFALGLWGTGGGIGKRSEAGFGEMEERREGVR